MSSPPVEVVEVVGVVVGVAVAEVGAEEAVEVAGVEVAGAEVAVEEVAVEEVAVEEVVVEAQAPVALVEAPAPPVRARVVQDREIPVTRAVQVPMPHHLAATTLRAPKETRDKARTPVRVMQAAAEAPAAPVDRADLADLADLVTLAPQESPVARLPRSEACPVPFSPIPGPGGSALRVRHSSG
jgi:hypothetical protein